MKLLNDIPLTPLRRVVQSIVIACSVLVLLTGQIAVNRQTQSLDLFGQVVWFHEMSLILLALALPLALLAALSSLLGRVFCGWLCPQTALCELLGSGQRAIRHARSRGVVGFVLTCLAVGVAAAMIVVGLGLALAAVIVSPATVLGVARGEFTTSLLKGITVTTLMVLFVVALLRHGFCEWICVVGWWQRLFANGSSLNVTFARDRAKECLRCNECKTTCFMGIDPRRPKLPKTCLNCARCVDACAAKMATVGSPTLIALRMGNRENRRASILDDGSNLANTKRGPATGRGRRALLVNGAAACALTLMIGGLLSWSASSRDVVQLKVRQIGGVGVELADGEARADYVVDMYNNGQVALALGLRQSGLPADAIFFEPNALQVAAKARASARFSLQVGADQLHAGRNEFRVIASDQSGQAPDSSYRIVFALPLTGPSGPARQAAQQRP